MWDIGWEIWFVSENLKLYGPKRKTPYLGASFLAEFFSRAFSEARGLIHLERLSVWLWVVGLLLKRYLSASGLGPTNGSYSWE